MVYTKFCRDCTDPDSPKMNNIGYVMSGYDIYFGNPIPIYDIVDPGTKSLVFAAEYNGDLTPDNRSVLIKTQLQCILEMLF